ncbi:MAG: branched-chain amino acid ABC transporter permease [Mycobacteriales bacterium]
MGQVLVLGLVSGGIYAMFAVGVVLVYRGTGVLTFAQGEIGTIALYLGAYLSTDRGLPWGVGALGALVLAASIGMLFELLVVRRMVGADKVSVSVATVGLVLFLIALEFQLFGDSPKALRGPLAGGVKLAGVIVSPAQIAALVIAVALGFGLQSALRRSDFGLGILASAQDPTAVRLVGVPLSRISLVLWGSGAAVSALAALLVEPTVGVFAPGYASELYVVGLAAACVGGLTSLPGAVVGGLVLGVAEAAANRYLGQYGLSGLRYVVVFAVLLVTLIGRSVLPDLRRRLDAGSLRVMPAGAAR